MRGRWGAQQAWLQAQCRAAWRTRALQCTAAGPHLGLQGVVHAGLAALERAAVGLQQFWEDWIVMGTPRPGH